MVECEFFYSSVSSTAMTGFNRYMVECESANIAGFRICFALRFNRYMVECEFFPTMYVLIYATVLIDTWWNVNFFDEYGAAWKNNVLIDTWWNVNGSIKQEEKQEVEVLIDTWWNVN